MRKTTTNWDDRQVRHLTDRIAIKFSPVLEDYMTDGYAVCPTCNQHVISSCQGPVHGGRVIVLTLRCPRCGSAAERDFLEVSRGRTEPRFRRESRF
jgi:DNA-directed RNA polymerase subunit RPC12/RpoP